MKLSKLSIGKPDLDVTHLMSPTVVDDDLILADKLLCSTLSQRGVVRHPKTPVSKLRPALTRGR